MANNEKALSKIRAMLFNEGVAFTDKNAALKSISETVLPTKLTKIYLQELEKINGRS
jgi:hypothetical protein